MGYSHYYHLKKKIDDKKTWDKMINDIEIILNLKKIPIQSNDPSKMLIATDKSWVNFNGVGDHSHETFVLNYYSFPDGNFIKTALKPYDLYVCGCLLLVHHYFPNHYEISSDGADEWIKAVKLNSQLFKYAFKLPPIIENRLTIDAKTYVEKIEAEIEKAKLENHINVKDVHKKLKL